MGKTDLSSRGGGLLLFEPEPVSGETEMPTAHRDRSGRYEDHVLPTRTAARNVIGQNVEPSAVDLAAIGSQQRGADLHDEAPSIGQRLGWGWFAARLGDAAARPDRYGDATCTTDFPSALS